MPEQGPMPTVRPMLPWPDTLQHILSCEGPVESAKALLGCLLAGPEGRLARLVETEAYGGAEDLGSHACRGIKPKCASMFGPPGHAYVYLSYGCHWMLNVVCCPEGVGSAVLVRAAEPISGLDKMRSLRGETIPDRDLLRGPGKLARAYGLDRRHDGLSLFDEKGYLRLVQPDFSRMEPLQSRRVGLTVGRGDDLPWRFILQERLHWASRGPLL